MEELIIKKIKPAFVDERGAIIDVVDKQIIKHVGLITSKKGSVRANHYHKKQNQMNYILNGKLEFTIKDPRKQEAGKAEKKTFILEKGDFIYIPPLVIHSVKALEDSEFIDMHDLERGSKEYEEDTVRVNVN